MASSVRARAWGRRGKPNAAPRGEPQPSEASRRPESTTTATTRVYSSSPGSWLGLTLRAWARRRSPRITLVVGSTASFMAVLDALVVATALPTMHTELGASISTLGWTVSAYSLTFAALILTGSALADSLGRRQVFLGGLAIFTVASVACAAAPSAAFLVAARAVQGAGAGLAVPLTLVLISEAYPGDGRGAAIGVWGAVSGLAAGIGPLVGGVIVEGMSWRWIFWVNVPIGIALILVTASSLAESRGRARRLDLLGLVLTASTVFALTDALMSVPVFGWASGRVLGLLGAAVVLGAIFLVWEARTPRAMIPLGLLLRPGLVGAVSARAALAASLTGTMFLIPQYLQLARDVSPLLAGVALLPWTAPAAVIAPQAGRLADRLGERPVILAGLGVQAVGLLLLAATATPSAPYMHLVGGLVLVGIGSGLAFSTTASAALRMVPAADAGIAGGLSTTAQQVGCVLGVAAAAATFTVAGTYETSASFVNGLRPALLVTAALAGAGLLGALAVRTGRER